MLVGEESTGEALTNSFYGGGFGIKSWACHG